MSRNAYDSTTDTLIMVAGHQPVDNVLSSLSENPVQNKVIKGELDKTYKTDDAANTTIDNTDYVPMSDANGNRKKLLWSNIVAKIKSAIGISSGSTYLRRDGTWGTPTDTNTTYTFATGDSNGQIKVTPSNSSAQNVSVKGLGSAAYIDADKSGTANTIVQRSGYGYINAGNSATENPASYTAYAVFQDSDGWYRKAIKANYLSWLGILYISSTTLASSVPSGTETNICELTIVSAGTYIINAQAGFTTDINSYTAFLIRQDSSNITKIGKDKVTNGDMFNATLVKTLSSGVVIRIRIYQASGSSKIVNNVYLSAIRIA